MAGCPLDAYRLKQIAFNICYQVRSGKASDANSECNAFAEKVASECLLDYSSILEACKQNVLDPWGTDIFLGWLGQLFAPNAMPSPDCPYIANQVADAVQYAITLINQGVSADEAVADALNRANEDSKVWKTIEEMMYFVFTVNMMNQMMETLNETLSNPMQKIKPMISEIAQLVVVIMIINML